MSNDVNYNGNHNEALLSQERLIDILGKLEEQEANFEGGGVSQFVLFEPFDGHL